MPQTLVVPTLEEVRTAIAMGALDGDLHHLSDAIARRAEFTRKPLHEGQIVEFNDPDSNPAYLHGTRWRVQRVLIKNVSLRPEQNAGGRPLPLNSRYTRGLRCPASKLVPVA
jgi:hypothetical protein